MENKLFPQYDSMPVEELEALLSKDSYLDEEGNEDELLYVCGLLADREKAAGTWIFDSSEKSWDDFKTYYAPEYFGLKPKGRFSIWFYRIKTRLKLRFRRLKVQIKTRVRRG